METLEIHKKENEKQSPQKEFSLEEHHFFQIYHKLICPISNVLLYYNFIGIEDSF